MNGNHEFLAVGLVLILPGLYLLWYARGHPEFYQEKRWERWRGRAAIAGALLGLVCRLGGTAAVKHCFQVVALLSIGVGIWAMLST